MVRNLIIRTHERENSSHHSPSSVMNPKESFIVDETRRVLNEPGRGDCHRPSSSSSSSCGEDTTNSSDRGRGRDSTAVRLSSLCVGMWRSRRHASLWMIIAPRRRAFVFVVEYEEVDVGSGVLRQLGAESPFASSKKMCGSRSVLSGRKDRKDGVSEKDRGNGMSVAFEVGFDTVMGVDYSNPLVRKGRMVVEACHVVKKEFPSIDDVLMYYYCCDGETLVTRKCSCSVREEEMEAEMDSCRDVERQCMRKSLLSSMDTVADDASFEFDTIANNNKEEDEIQSAETSGAMVEKRPKVQAAEVGNNNTSGKDQVVGEFDTPVKVYSFRSISIEWTDVHVPCALLPVFENDERLLKMYESGLPTWAKLLPAYGFYYRPWLRSLTWILFYLFSIFSLAVGFWDLYKTLPGLQEILAKVVGSLWLPPTAVLQWIEEHAQIRLSILLTYLFGKSEMLLFVMKHAGPWWRSVCALVEPLYGSTMGPILLFMKVTGFQVVQLTYSIANSTVIPVAVFLRNACGVILTPLLLLWRLAKQSWSALSLICAAFFSSGSGSTAVTGGWLFWALPAEAVRVSLVRSLRALNAVWKFTVNVCTGISRHRLTLSRRFRRWRIRCTDQLSRIAMILFWKIVDFFMGVYEYLPRSSPSRASSVQEHGVDSVEESHTPPPASVTTVEQSSLSFSKAFVSEHGLRHRQALEDTADSKVAS